jgi:hypothetical protein
MLSAIKGVPLSTLRDDYKAVSLDLSRFSGPVPL